MQILTHYGMPGGAPEGACFGLILAFHTFSVHEGWILPYIDSENHFEDLSVGL